MIRQLKDSYGRDMLRYKALSAGLLQQDETGGLKAAADRPANSLRTMPDEILNEIVEADSSEEALPALQKWGDEE